jgi:hypothetical protein
MAGRTSIEHIAESDFRSLLTALSASRKGRAFLTEYRRRSLPAETDELLETLARIESAIGGIRDQLKPERLADELRRIAMFLEIAADGTTADPEGDEAARRMALVGRARLELSMLAASLAGGFESVSAQFDAIEDGLNLGD